MAIAKSKTGSALHYRSHSFGNDVDTGIPLAVMDCVWITAMRTAAASVVGAKCWQIVPLVYPGIAGAATLKRSMWPFL
ncbi:MAG: hypothetical protein H6667_20295 [Ardenticatenaceae bacterium]|nr:hypothetical protein [Ardenticatenaceae bacterium]